MMCVSSEDSCNDNLDHDACDLSDNFDHWKCTYEGCAVKGKMFLKQETERRHIYVTHKRLQHQ